MKIFKRIYEKNVWKSKESISGPGSTLKQTEKIRKKIPLLIKSKKIKSILDIPCGDFNWMNEIKIDKLNVNYIGADVVEELVKKNKQKYKKDNINFLKLNLIKDELPKVDLILCRDCLIHFSYKNIFLAINNMKNSGSKYLLTTNFTDLKKNKNIRTGGWRMINLELTPFNFPKPKLIIKEGYFKDKYSDKSLCLWELEKFK